MAYRTLTVAREFGSGGAATAKLVAERLGWRLVDNSLVLEVARAARVDPSLARRFDECVDPWLHRVSRAALWRGGFEVAGGDVSSEVFDARTMTHLANGLIKEAHRLGDCVVVGRGAQCLLQGESDAFHVFVYAPMAQRITRMKKRGAASDREALDQMKAMDDMRSQFVRMNFESDWREPHLYDLMVSSARGVEWAAGVIADAMGRELPA